MMNQHVVLNTTQKLDNPNMYSLAYSKKKIEIHQMLMMIVKRRVRIRIMNRVRARAKTMSRLQQSSTVHLIQGV